MKDFKYIDMPGKLIEEWRSIISDNTFPMNPQKIIKTDINSDDLKTDSNGRVLSNRYQPKNIKTIINMRATLFLEELIGNNIRYSLNNTMQQAVDINIKYIKKLAEEYEVEIKNLTNNYYYSSTQKLVDIDWEVHIDLNDSGTYNVWRNRYIHSMRIKHISLSLNSKFRKIKDRRFIEMQDHPEYKTRLNLLTIEESVLIKNLEKDLTNAQTLREAININFETNIQTLREAININFDKSTGIEKEILNAIDDIIDPLRRSQRRRLSAVKSMFIESTLTGGSV